MASPANFSPELSFLDTTLSAMCLTFFPRPFSVGRGTSFREQNAHCHANPFGGLRDSGGLRHDM